MNKKSIPGSTTNLGESELDTPHFTLVAKTIFTNDLQLRVTLYQVSPGSSRWTDPLCELRTLLKLSEITVCVETSSNAVTGQNREKS